MVETRLSAERRKDEAVKLRRLSVSIVGGLGLDKLKGMGGVRAVEGVSSQLRAVSSPASPLQLQLLLRPLSSPSPLLPLLPLLLYSAEAALCSLDAAASVRLLGSGLSGVS